MSELNDRWTVEFDRPKRTHEIGDEPIRTETSGAYSNVKDAMAWAQKVINNDYVLAVRIRRHSWSSEIIYEEKKETEPWPGSGTTAPS